MNTSPLAALVAAAAAPLLLATPAAAQWHVRPHNAAGAVHATDWYVAHDTGSGLVAVSAIAPTWANVSPAGATFVQLQDKCLVTRESATTLRGWSALHNASATQSVSANVVVLSDPNAESFVVLRDDAPGTFGVLRAYSAFTNTWSSRPLVNPPAPFVQWRTGVNTGAFADGTNLYAYSAHSAAWSSQAVGISLVPSLAGVDYVAHHRPPTNDYVVFNALRGTWSVSPVLSTVVTPGSDPPVVAAASSCVFTIRVPDPTGPASAYRLAGYSARTDQWSTSPVAHLAGTVTTSALGENIARFDVSTPSGLHFETFGAATGWAQLMSGTFSVFTTDDHHVVVEPAAASMTVHVRSALTGGAYAAVTVPITNGSISGGMRQTVVTAGSSLATAAAWGWSPRTGAFAGPVPMPLGTNVSLGQGDSVHGFVVQGSLGVGTSPQAFTARHGTWVAGPVIQPNHTWQMLGAGSVLAADQIVGGTRLLHPFDERTNQWRAPVPISLSASPRAGGNSLVAASGLGTWTGYSAQRADWVTRAGLGSSPPPNVIARGNLAWFVDGNNDLVVFTTPGRAQAWSAWPLAGEYTSGGIAGLQPPLGISLRGSPTEYALLYAALGRPPAPITIPGVLGALDLDPLGAVQVAAPGLFDADGVHVVRLQVPGAVPAGLEVSLQLVTVDLPTGVIALHDRATSSFVF
jgi:hypothetical protein